MLTMLITLLLLKNVLIFYEKVKHRERQIYCVVTKVQMEICGIAVQIGIQKKCASSKIYQIRLKAVEEPGEMAIETRTTSCLVKPGKVLLPIKASNMSGCMRSPPLILRRDEEHKSLLMVRDNEE